MKRAASFEVFLAGSRDEDVCSLSLEVRLECFRGLWGLNNSVIYILTIHTGTTYAVRLEAFLTRC